MSATGSGGGGSAGPGAKAPGSGSVWLDGRGQPVPDPYALLGLTPGAPPAEVQARYRELIRAHPPERDPEGFERIAAAHRRLTDPAQRLTLQFGRIGHLPVGEESAPEPRAARKPALAPPAPAKPRPLADELFIYALVHSLRP